ncbi:MAG: SPOR domain-containing protein [Halioglobus sp.]
MAQERDETNQSAGNGTNGTKNPFDKRIDAGPGDFGLEGDFYEEPDRDTDGSASFYEHSIEEDEGFTEGERPRPTGAESPSSFSKNTIDEELDEGLDELDDELDSLTDDWDEQDMTPEQEAEAWLDERGYPADEGDGSQSWPLGLIAVAVVALVLLIAGGYGVMQQRSATQEEIRELRAALATAASPEEVTESRTAAAEAEQRNIQLKEQLYTLSAENRRLSDTVTGLETQMAVQQKALSTAMDRAKPKITSAAALAATKAAAKPKPVAPKVAARPAPKAKPAPKVTPKAKPAPVQVAAKPKSAPIQSAKPAVVAKTTAKPAAIATSTAAAAPAIAGSWFVNFGSYSSLDTAQSWVKKLKPSAGRVITAPGERDGRTFYRVRVVDLPNKLSAQNVAGGLEQQHNLSKLWIGKQS